MSKEVNEKCVAVMEAIAQGYSYEQILAAYPNLTYLDIFGAAEEVLTFINNSGRDYHQRLQEIKKKYPRAYEKWTVEEENRLKDYFETGRRIPFIASDLQRQPSAIRSKLIKMQLIQEK